MKKISISYIYTGLVTVGGTDRVLTNKANYLADILGYKVSIITDTQLNRPPAFPLSPNVRLIDLNVDFSQEYEHSLPIRVYYYFRLMRLYKRKLKTKLDEINPDIVISTMGREMDFITSLKRPGRVIIGEVHLAKPFIRNFHLMRQRGGIHKIVAQYWMHKQECHTSKLDTLVALTKDDADSWKNIVKTSVIPNSYSFYPEVLSYCKYGKTVISVGRYSEQKGYDLLFQAWKFVFEKHPDWQLNIFGNGLIKNKYECQIQELGLSKVIHLKDPVKDIEKEYEQSEFYVMSSRFEGFGMVLVEAMTCGIPCVSFNCPHGPSDIITDNEDGLLVENGNVEKLAKAICYMIEHDLERHQMGIIARSNVKKYSPYNIMLLWDELFHNLINKD